MNGYGILTESEVKYEGEWKQNLKEGLGFEVFNSNESYIGFFHKGKRNKYGQFIFGDNSIYIGEWYLSKFDGMVRL